MAAKKAPAKVPTPIVPTTEAPAKRTRSLNLVLQVGLITLPIKLSTGARAETVTFHKLHTACLGPLKMQGGSAGSMYCPTCTEYVAPDEQVKGFEHSKGNFVTMTQEEIDAQRPDTDKVVEVDLFVDANEIDPIYFQSSHYISPGEGGTKAFLLVRDALRKSGKVALGKATIDKNEHLILIRPFGDGLALHQMFYQAELNLIPYPIDQMTVTDAEMKLAGQLIESMSGSFEPTAYHDRHLANLRSLIASKMAGKSVAVPPKAKRPAPGQDLFAALSASVDAAKKRKAA